jgi:hypothetical protein
VAFANKFIVQGTTDAGLSAAQFLGALSTGIVKNTTTTGVLSIAVAADFPTLNQSTTGNAATVTTNANLTGPITSVGNATSVASQTGTGSKFVMDTSPTLVTPNLGTPSAVVLTNGTGLPIGGISATGTPSGTTFLRGDGTWATATGGGGGDALTTNPLSQFAATTSLQLKNVISDETGSGALVFATSPTLVTPALGTPSAVVLTNATGLTIGGISATGTPDSTTFLRGDGAWATAKQFLLGGGGVYLEYIFDSTTSFPATGARVRYNNATFASITQININSTDNAGTDITTLLSKISIGCVMQISSGAVTRYNYFTVTSVTNNTGNFTLGVTPLIAEGNFGTNESIYIGFVGLPQNLNTTATPTFGSLTVTGTATANAFVGTNVTAVNGNGTLLNPGTSQIAVTVPSTQQLSLIYMDIRNNQTTNAASNFYGMFIRTEGDAVDVGAAISIENNGKSDGIYLGIKGKAGVVTGNTPSGIGMDLNHASGGGENSPNFGGTGIHVWDFSTTHNGDNGATFIKLSKEGDLNNDNRMLYIRGNQRHLELYTPEGTGYDGTKSVLKLFNNTATKFNMLASGFIGINKDPTVQLDITDAGEVGVVIANSATSDTRAKLSLTGNATNGRGHLVVSGKHSGFDGTQNGDGPAIFEMIGDNSATHPTKFAWTIAATTKMLKLDVTDDGAGGTVTGAMKVLVNGNVQLGKTLVLAAGTTTVPPIQYTAGTNLTSATAGTMEYDGTVFYATPAASTRHLNTIEQFIMLSSNYTLTSQTAAQKAFNASTNGAVTLPVGTYTFEAMIRLSSMSGTSGSFGFALGGTATFTQAWTAVAALSAATVNAQISYNTAANTSLTTAGTAGSGQALIKGEIRVTVTGTIIPQVSLTIAAAAVVNLGSYFRVTPMGSSTVTNVGNWS